MENNENNVQNQEKKAKNGLSAPLVIIILIAVLIIGIGGGFLLANKDKNSNANTTETQYNKQEQNKASKKIDESKPWVYDAEYGNNKTVKTIEPWNSEVNPNSKDDLVVPYININSVEGEKANKEIKALYEEMYESYATDAGGIGKKGCSLKYKFYENKNILSIVIENSNFVVPGGAGKCPLYIYNFNLDTLENATNEELAKQTGYSSISEVEDIVNKWVAREKTGEETGGSFIGLVKDTYFIDGSNKLNFVYIVGAAGTFDYAKKVDEVKETKSNDNPTKYKANTYTRPDNTNRTSGELTITNFTNESFDFEINATYVNGENVEESIARGGVNLGDVSGTAKKIAEGKYQFVPEKDDELMAIWKGEYKINFTVKNDSTIEIEEIYDKDKYSQGPYSGGNVRFDGTYIK